MTQARSKRFNADYIQDIYLLHNSEVIFPYKVFRKD